MHQLRQFWLLVQKDLILVRRNKLWTFFEIFVPCLMLFPYVLLMFGLDHITKGTEDKIASQSFGSFKIHGNGNDSSQGVNGLTSCNSNENLFGYTSTDIEKISEVKRLMEEFRKKFQGFSMKIVEFSDESKLDETLKNEYKSSGPNRGCWRKFSGGVVVDEIDWKKKILKYRMRIPDSNEKWHVGDNWERETATVEALQWGIYILGTLPRKENVPVSPPYFKNGVLTLQHALESTFVEYYKKRNDNTITFQALPIVDHYGSMTEKFLFLAPIVFALISFVSVVHISRDIAAETQTVKPFLKSMGLSTPMFYSSHIFVGFIKYFIVVLIATTPFYSSIMYVNPLPVIVTLSIYGIGALTFGTLIASLFNNPNSAIKAIVILWPVMIGLAYALRPSNDHFFTCFLYALNINGALSLSIREICNSIARGVPLNVFNMFNGSTAQLSFGSSLLLMVFHIFLMFGLACLVDYCRHSGDFSLRTMFRREHSEEFTDGRKTSGLYQQVRMSELEAADDLLEGANEIDGARSSARAGISVRNLVKEWATTGEKAVDGLTFEAKQGQVSILLGHNGAGKSTTFQSIVGMIKPTQGRISIYGKDVSQSHQDIGLCPQNNPLYDKLTVKEHLWLVNGLKGRTKDRAFYNEMNQLLKDVDLMDKKNERSMNLSGGMKRKLCVCMALIGQSKVVLLDEPTAGMDPGARKDVQDLLEREKKERTILLTTHYMDEAERLGDWILIMSHGKLVSSGTTKFLKQKYGTGYLLTVVLNGHGDKEKMSEILEDISMLYVKGAERGERHGQQVEIILPEDKKYAFPQLLKALEAIQREEYDNEVLSNIPLPLKRQMDYLEMTSFGLSLNTLEQVFITIGDKVEKKLADQKGDKIDTKLSDGFERFVESQSRSPEKNGLSRVVAQFCAIFRKKLLYTKRNWSTLISQLIIPIAIIAIIGSLQSFDFLSRADKRNSFELDNLSPANVIWQIDDGKEEPSQIAKKMREILENESGFETHKYAENENLMNIMERMRAQIPSPAFGFTRNAILFNLRNYHATPTLVTLYNRARLMDVDKVVPIIESGIFVYAERFEEDVSGINPMIIDVLMAPLLIVIFALVTSSFVIFLIEERVSMFTHQQLLTGISPATFYGASFFFDFLLFSIICSLFLFLFVIWNLMSSYFAHIILFWFLYFFSSVPFIYAISTFFESPSKANVLLVIWQIFISCTAMIIRYIVLEIAQRYYKFDEKYIGYTHNAFSFFLPSYSFGVAIIFMNYLYPNENLASAEILKWDKLGKTATCMVLFGIFSFTLFVVLQFKAVRKVLSKCLFLRRTHVDSDFAYDFPPCEAVKLEEEKAEKASSDDYALIVKNLSKRFGRLVAVDRLCLTVEEKECFGLLGVNGSGKTTTFNILTGHSFATNGEAKIGGRDVTDRIPIGYCPQFDALLLDLTGREVLEILGQMHGFANYREKADLILECVGMRQNADKLVRYYSGGQKRKISVGVALLAPTQMIILDEPTAGIDPKARREVWELLIWCRENSNSALMLTSHSMDECEALCSRIAVLNRGNLIAIGTSQELKSLYGNSYTMTLTLNTPEDRDRVVNEVRDLLPHSVLRTTESNKTVNLVWQIPKKPDDHWSEKFELVHNLAKQLNVKDYILAQSSLEDTFLRLAGVDNMKV